MKVNHCCLKEHDRGKRTSYTSYTYKKYTVSRSTDWRIPGSFTDLPSPSSLLHVSLFLCPIRPFVTNKNDPEKHRSRTFPVFLWCWSPCSRVHIKEFQLKDELHTSTVIKTSKVNLLTSLKDLRFSCISNFLILKRSSEVNREDNEDTFKGLQ